MTNVLNPFNLNILVLDNKTMSRIGEVKDLGIFEYNTKNFTPEGLFSTEIFGNVGSDERTSLNGYIDLKVPILHPLIFKHITSLKRLYKDILSGSKYAIWDDDIKDFTLSNMEDGSTGYSFFLKHFKDIVFEETESDERNAKIVLLKEHSLAESTFSKFLVLEAGLRDYTVSDDGKPSEDEVNTIYRKILGVVNLLNNTTLSKSDMSLVDPTRYRLQNLVIDVYNYFLSLMDGKKKFIQSKWSKRAIVDGTRNVITALPLDMTGLKNDNKISFNDTVVGLYQYAKAILPVTKHLLRNKVLNRIFTPNSTSALLVDKKSLMTVQTDVDFAVRDEWLSGEGINNIINKLAQEEFRNEQIMIGDNYLVNLYNNGSSVKIVFNTNELPDETYEKHLQPITYAELLYMVLYETVGKYPGLLARYPVVGLGGIYPTNVYLKTTVRGKKVSILNDNWEKTITVNEFPLRKGTYFNSLSPHYSRLERLTADFDGDVTSLVLLTSDDSRKEIEDLLATRKHYVDPVGNLTYSTSNAVLTNVLQSMTS